MNIYRLLTVTGSFLLVSLSTTMVYAINVDQSFIYYALLMSVISILITYLSHVTSEHTRSMWKRQALAQVEGLKQGSNANAWFNLMRRIYLVNHSRHQLMECGDKKLLSELPQLDRQVCRELYEGRRKENIRLSEQTNERIYLAVRSWLEGLPSHS